MGDLDISAQLREAKARKWDDRTLAQRAADMAQELLTGGLRLLRSDERTLLSALSRLVADEKNRRFLRDLCAQVLHAPDNATRAERLRRLLADFGGVPTFFSTVGRLRLKAAAVASRSMLGPAMSEVQRVFRSTFGELTLPTQMDKVSKRVKECARDGLTLALHPLAPIVYGAKSAERYRSNLESILSRQSDVGLVIQPWRLCHDLSPASPEASARALSERLRPLLKQSLQGKEPPRPVLIESGTSDIIPIVVEGVKLALAGAEYHKAHVILELPAYLRTSPGVLRELSNWAEARAAKGARPLHILIDKGSHLAQEHVCAFDYGKEDTLSASRAETDTRYKQLLHTAIAAKAQAIVPVVGTHNLYDIAYALLDWGRCGREGLPPFALTAGLGNHTGRLLAKAGADVILTAAVSPEEAESSFEHYLLTLLNELSLPDGFLSAGYAVEPNSIGWGRMRQHFLASLSGREETRAEQKERGFPGRVALGHLYDRAYVDAFYAAAQAEHERPQALIPLTLGGQTLDSPLTCIHRSLTAPGLEDYRFISADYDAVHQALRRASQATARIPSTPEERGRHLLLAARLLEKERQKLEALLIRDAGFSLTDAEVELRNAIDACLYYEQSARQDGLLDGTQATPLGVVVVAGSSAHPLADAVAGIAAAWVTGNAIIYKPAAYTTLTGMQLTGLLREAGLEDPLLQCLPCLDNGIAERLMSDELVSGVIFSGAEQEARKLASRTPTHTLLCASTGAAVVYLSAQGDWRQAVQDIVRAAFRRSGQSPDCPHLVLVHAAVYDNQLFINALKDAVTSLKAQPGWLEGGQLGPLASPLNNAERHLLTQLDAEEAWLVQPCAAEIGSLIWSPGVRTGVKPDSLFVQRGKRLPQLGLMRVESTEEALPLQAQLTGGRMAILYSTDEQEISHWSAHMPCATLSINCCPPSRPGLLPSGTCAPALCGIATLSGGPNYLTALCQWQENARPQRRGKQRNMPFAPWESLSPKPTPDEAMRLTTAADSLSYWWENEFGITRTINPRPGEKAELRYLAEPVCLRVEKATSDIDLSIALMAALKAGSPVQISTVTLRAWMPRVLEPLGVPLQVESREEFERRFAALASDGVRVRDTAATDSTLTSAAACGLRLSRTSVLANGRLELLHCLREQIISRHTAHHGLLAD